MMTMTMTTMMMTIMIATNAQLSVPLSAIPCAPMASLPSVHFLGASHRTSEDNTDAPTQKRLGRRCLGASHDPHPTQSTPSSTDPSTALL